MKNWPSIVCSSQTGKVRDRIINQKRRRVDGCVFLGLAYDDDIRLYEIIRTQRDRKSRVFLCCLIEHGEMFILVKLCDCKPPRTQTSRYFPSSRTQVTEL